jgi:hypothetical protein
MIEETQPNNVSQTSPQKVSKRSRVGVLVSVLVLIIALALGGASGYTEGVGERVSAKSTLVTAQLSDQFLLVQKDIDEGRYSVAQKRLEFIIQQEPNYPGAAEKLADVLVKQAITPTPVPTETATVTPTPDMRSQETIFAQALQQQDAKDWTGLMKSLDSLRKADPTYKVTIVDGMYFTALRNRGVEQILGSATYKTTNLEGGIYDLTLAERFGPLDGYAAGLRSFAREYIVASSFWDVNWSQAVNLFRQVYQNTPNLRDASNYTAGMRLHDALLAYGDQLAAKSNLKDSCPALDAWQEANTITPLEVTYAAKYNKLFQQCFPPTGVPTVILETPTTDPNATIAGPTAAPTSGATSTPPPPPTPTETPIPVVTP